MLRLDNARYPLAFSDSLSERWVADAGAYGRTGIRVLGISDEVRMRERLWIPRFKSPNPYLTVSRAISVR